MDAADGLEQLFAEHTAVPALAVLQQLRKDLSQQQAQKLLKNHRDCLQLGTCSFGRRGRASYALRTQAEVQRLFNIANISDEDAAHFWATGVGLRLRGPHGAAAVRVAHPHDGCVCGDGTADTTSLLNDSQANRDHAEHGDPSCGTGKCLPMWACDWRLGLLCSCWAVLKALRTPSSKSTASCWILTGASKLMPATHPPG
ncbi:hypothetical protein VOLCADRAFT_107719 [Volvox carteri f. nagariensis]|uniref:Uncharacterized protein n=1 Tax=Volvox carteri f. nagariensis TaxID=3068 RepID=D8UFV1_VOLCA|nr:uncharacterized protein VOLCADRAFT_107719 [Volvox carteri f. nagariensis]EFJ41444.1 hypothetical protein VOLCADRAFT_107719 [Volvox carteri f. nagariensis]|eukprot:XP_002957550.1 hypothetical protein VOLCADRAFT_107719 [Volvox carteri f. nagariensis]